MNRPYRRALRDQQVAQTRERIIDAVIAQLGTRALPTDVDAVTYAAVAEQAGVSERTVYRAFPTKRELVAATIETIERKSGYVDPRTPEDVVATADRLRAFGAFGFGRSISTENKALRDNRVRRYAALRAALAPVTAGLDDRKTRATCAVFQLLTSIESLQRAVDRWGVTSDEVATAFAWAASCLVRDLEKGEGPWKRTPRTRRKTNGAAVRSR